MPSCRGKGNRERHKMAPGLESEPMNPASGSAGLHRPPASPAKHSYLIDQPRRFHFRRAPRARHARRASRKRNTPLMSYIKPNTDMNKSPEISSVPISDRGM